MKKDYLKRKTYPTDLTAVGCYLSDMREYK